MVVGQEMVGGLIVSFIGFYITIQSEEMKILINMYMYEASRSAGAQGVTVKLTGCGFDPRSTK